jgi:hypothetical protein
VWHTTDWRVGSCFACTAALTLCPMEASAQGFAFSLEPGVPLNGAQPQALRLPSAASLKALLGLGRCVDLSLGAGFVGLPSLSDSSSPMSGTASMFGVGLRLKRPHDQRTFYGASPWVDAEALSVHGGPIDRRALSVGAGLAFPMGRERSIWLGPFVRYLQIMQPNVAGHDQRASDGMFAGLTFEVAFPARPAR